MAAYFEACIIADKNHMMPNKAGQLVVVMGVHVVLLNMFAGIAACRFGKRKEKGVL